MQAGLETFPSGRFPYVAAGSLIAFLGIALLDSINPSAIVVTLQLLSRRAPLGAILAYVGAVFLTYTSVMVLLVLGLTALLAPLTAFFATTAANVGLAVLGAGMLAYALFSKNPKDSPQRPPMRLSAGTAGGLFLLGVTVTLAELPTALPLVGAVGLLTSANLSAAAWVVLVLVYNVIFVLPPLLLTFGYRWLGDRAGEALQKRLTRGAKETMLWILGIVGFYMLTYALSELGVFGDSVSVTFG